LYLLTVDVDGCCHVCSHTFGKTPLDERSARLIELYLTTHKSQDTESHSPGGIRTRNPKSERPQTDGLEGGQRDRLRLSTVEHIPGQRRVGTKRNIGNKRDLFSRCPGLGLGFKNWYRDVFFLDMWK